MLIKLTALGALGYLGYRFLQFTNRAAQRNHNPLSELRIAGGPLSDAASVQHSANKPPPVPAAT